MNILCTGSSGFIGTNLVELLIQNGNKVINLDISKPRNTKHNEYFLKCDIRNKYALVEAVTKFSPDIIVHLAARTDLHGQYLNDYSANIDGVNNIVAASKKCDSIKLILFASSRLVCKIGYQPENEVDYCPTTLYGESKVLGEKIIRENADQIPCPWLIFRPTSIWGPWFDTPYKEFFMSIINKHYIHPRGRSVKKSFGYVGNTIYAINQLINDFPQELNQKTIYMCDYQPIDVLSWANEIASLYGVHPPFEVNLSVLKFLADCGDILRKFGMKEPPLTSFRLSNILTDMIYDTSLLEKNCGPLPYSQRQGIEATLKWIKESQE